MKIFFHGLLLLVLATSGCTSRAKARAQAQAAFAAGQQQALARMNDARRTSIYVIGNVRYREIPWSEGLTLAQAIVAADCLDRRDRAKSCSSASASASPWIPKSCCGRRRAAGAGRYG